MSSTEEKDYAFHEEWIRPGNEETDFGSYVSVDKELAIYGIWHQWAA
jgi:hypothetical protein